MNFKNNTFNYYKLCMNMTRLHLEESNTLAQKMFKFGINP